MKEDFRKPADVPARKQSIGPRPKPVKDPANQHRSATSILTHRTRLVAVDATPSGLKDRARRRVIRNVLQQLRSLDDPRAADIARVINGRAPRRTR